MSYSNKTFAWDDQPTFPNSIGGFRIFHLDPLKRKLNKKEGFDLGSLYQRSAWAPGLNSAECLPFFSDIKATPCSNPPEQDCLCGFQAYYFFKPDIIIEPGFFESYAIASVAGGGKTFMHHDGWRAEKAQITGLFMPDYSFFIKEDALEKATSIQNSVALEYSVPLFRDYKKFIDYVSSVSTVIPRKHALKPKTRGLIKKTFGPLSLNDEIDVHGGECSIQIISSVNYPDYEFRGYPPSHLKRKRGILFPPSFRLDSFRKDVNIEFYKKSSDFISKSESSSVLKTASFLDSIKQYILLFIAFMSFSTILNVTDIVQPPLSSLILILWFVGLLYLLKFSKRRTRMRFVNSINSKIKSN